MRLLSYNVHGCIGRRGAPSASAILTLIENADADVVALQEVQDHDEADRSFLRALDRLPYRHVLHGPTMRKEEGPYGNLLLSRHELTSYERIDLSVPGYEPRGAILARLVVEGRELEVLTIHLGLWSWERRKQIAMLGEALSRRRQARSPDVRLAVGDFNEWRRRSANLRRLESLLGASLGPRTYPARFPLLRLDRVFADPGDVLSRVEAVDGRLARRASDHRPLMLTLTM
jgi:endonuclease/exonuclease/phosphatase family metal-dependent hydrolase